jgi:hypothetical protein
LSEEEGVTNNIDISRITFAQTQEDGGAVEFSATEWTFGDLQNLAPGDCYQLWMPFYSDIAAGVAPADICTSRKGLFTTRRPFWLSDNPEATFSVLLDGEQLLTCPTALNITEEEFAGGDVSFGADMRCIVDLP